MDSSSPERTENLVWHEKTVDEKLTAHKQRSRKRFWTKIALITLAVLIPIIILIVCLAVLIPRKHQHGNHNGHGGPSYLPDGAPVAHLTYGSYSGNRLSAGVHEFLGMRFAQPPTGDLRWRAPVAPQNFTGIQNATTYQPICHGVGAGIIDSQSEDCLFANVYAPANVTKSSPVPVWIYIQGGGYSGDNNPNYNGTQIVQTGNIVFVNFNYRVGAFGFLASETLRSNGDLNAGLLDQRAAMNWTRNNIASFGGDPDRIVIHGGSAGAGSVGHHLVAYGGRNDNFFHGAIAQSPYYQDEFTVADLEWQFKLYVADSACKDASDIMGCMRAQNVSKLQGADFSSPFPGHQQKPRHSWGPTVDGDFLPDYPMTLFKQGKVVNVPLMVGDEPDEGTLFVPNATDANDVKTFFNVNYPKLNQSELQSIVDQYPAGEPTVDHADYFGAAAQAYGESTLICPGIWMCDSLSRLNASAVWNYSFNVSATEDWENGLGAFHTIDSGAIFGPDYEGPPSEVATESFATYNNATVPVLMNYYLSFVKTLSPNPDKSSSAPQWGQYSQNGGRQRLHIEATDVGMEAVPAALMNNCQFWSGLQESMEL